MDMLHEEGQSINRNIVECKDANNWYPLYFFCSVLIETLWNVKSSHISILVLVSVVLIETLWNVKFLRSCTISVWWCRINRNIVECKDIWLVCAVGCAKVLIETLWNVKRLNNIVISSFFFSINRNIVECKDVNSWRYRRSLCVLIETLWNVKRILPSFSFNPASVLIETLWNVKQQYLLCIPSAHHVLIETLWNVKKIRKPLILLHGNRINRNIVECKEFQQRIERHISLGINRNIVECKGYYPSQSHPS